MNDQNLRFRNLTAMLSLLVLMVTLMVGCAEDSGRRTPPTAVPAESSTIPEIATQTPTDNSLEQSAIRFEWADLQSGIDFVREDDFTPRKRIIESTGGGVAIFDADADGLPDLVYVGGCKIPIVDDTITSKLFRNLGARQFSDTTGSSGLAMRGYGQGCAVGDVNADGFDDLYITAFGENALWLNNGDGTFVDATEAAGVSDSRWSTGCAFGDLNGDGHLDLYVVNYLDESADNPVLCPNPQTPGGFDQCPPSRFEGVDDSLFIADGSGRFIDQTESAGVSGRRGKGLGVLICDFDEHHLPEIYVANDGQGNFLFVAEEATGFELRYREQGMTSGVALSRSGYAQASMGIAHGDYDRNGTIDLLLTHFYGDSNTLYENQGELQFVDQTRRTGLAGSSRDALGWGTVLEDFDGDGLLDQFVANGHVEDRRWKNRGEPFEMLAQVFKNVGGGRFEECSNGAGEYFTQSRLGRGVAAGDLDRDGRIDLAVSHQLSPSGVLWNETTTPLATVPPHSSPFLKLIGVGANRSAIGTVVSGFDGSGEELWRRQCVGGGSYLSASCGEFLLPMGTVKVTIDWPKPKDFTEETRVFLDFSQARGARPSQ